MAQLIIFGMHRSGTSALTALLNKMGAYYGPEQLSTGANEENPKGFWERRDVRDLNDLLLNSMDCDWDKVSRFDFDHVPTEVIEEFNFRAKTIGNELNTKPLSVIKEPRMCLLFPLWRRHFRSPVAVHIYRNPLEVAKSLKKRNQIPLHIGVALWERYLTAAINNTGGIPRIFTAHQTLMTDPIGFTERIFGQLSQFNIEALVAPSEEEINSLVTLDLYRNRNVNQPINTYLNEVQSSLFEALADDKVFDSNLELELSLGAIESLSEFDNNVHANKVKQLEKTNHEVGLEIQKKREAIEGLQAQLHACELDSTELRTQLHASKLDREELRAQLNLTNLEGEVLRDQLNAVRLSWSWRIMAPIRVLLKPVFWSLSYLCAALQAKD